MWLRAFQDKVSQRLKLDNENLDGEKFLIIYKAVAVELINENRPKPNYLGDILNPKVVW